MSLPTCCLSNFLASFLKTSGLSAWICCGSLFTTKSEKKTWCFSKLDWFGPPTHPDIGNDAVPGCSSFGCTLALAVATCWPTSPFLPCLEARSASCRALLSAFNSALLLAGLSAGAALSGAGTGTEAGTAEGAETERLCTNNHGSEKYTGKKMWNYYVTIPLWAVICAEGWGAGRAGGDFFSLSPGCDVLSSFFSLLFLCCFFSFLKRCFSSFVNSFPSFCICIYKRTAKTLQTGGKTGLRGDLDKFEHGPWFVRCHRSRESLLQKPSVDSHLTTPLTDVCLTLRLWASQTAPRSRHQPPFQ